jgi:hypothetical protein
VFFFWAGGQSGAKDLFVYPRLYAAQIKGLPIDKAGTVFVFTNGQPTDGANRAAHRFMAGPIVTRYDYPSIVVRELVEHPCGIAKWLPTRRHELHLTKMRAEPAVAINCPKDDFNRLAGWRAVTAHGFASTSGRLLSQFSASSSAITVLRPAFLAIRRPALIS